MRGRGLVRSASRFADANSLMALAAAVVERRTDGFSLSPRSGSPSA
jgi:hypothetical protein